MKDFRYARPTSIDEAVRLLAGQGRAKVLAGGTDLIVQLRERLCEADLVVDAKRIPELMALRYRPETGLQLGASVPCCRLYEDRAIAAAYPALADAARRIGSWQIQSRASVGGNLCNSSPSADCAAPLIVHSACCHLAGPAGRRTVPVERFCTGPGQNVLQPGELLVALTLPPPAPRSGSAYERFIPRNEMDIAVAGVASWVQLDETGASLSQARIALAAVAPTPRLAPDAGRWLAGRRASGETFAEAGELAKRAAAPIDDVRGTAEFRTHLVGVLTQRALTKAVQRARSRRA